MQSTHSPSPKSVGATTYGATYSMLVLYLSSYFSRLCSLCDAFRIFACQPYRMVKDLRTNYEVSEPDSVLEGELDGFILNFLSSSLDKDDDSL